MRPVDPPRDLTRTPDDPPTDARRPAAADRSADSLRHRLDHLPPGHPSSPHDADGGSRQSAFLRDLDTAEKTISTNGADQKYEVTDAEWAEHVVEVREGLASA